MDDNSLLTFLLAPIRKFIGSHAQAIILIMMVVVGGWIFLTAGSNTLEFVVAVLVGLLYLGNQVRRYLRTRANSSADNPHPLSRFIEGHSISSVVVQPQAVFPHPENTSPSAQTNTVGVTDSFLVKRTRAGTAGAAAGLFGSLIGVVVLGVLLEAIVATSVGANGETGVSGVGWIAMFVCSPCVLVGYVFGKAVGRFAVRKGDDFEKTTRRFDPQAGGGLAGLSVSALSYLLFALYWWLTR